jgi:hypothetical protein
MEVDAMNAWTSVTVLGVAWLTWRLIVEFRRQELDDVVAENLELREEQVDAYLVGYLEGRRDEQAERA